MAGGVVSLPWLFYDWAMQKKIVICGIGNPYRSDDGAGVHAARMLASDFASYICETTPERFIDEICEHEAETVIIIDSANFDGEPGEYRKLDVEDVENYTITTHIIPIPLIVKMLERCGKKVEIYGIQFGDISFGDRLSPEVEKGVERLIAELKSKFSQ